jgi:predicted transcriptional regulator
LDEELGHGERTAFAEAAKSVRRMADELKPSASGAIDLDEIAELDRRWAAIEAGEPRVSHDEVVRWLETWGTPAFRPRHKWARVPPPY